MNKKQLYLDICERLASIKVNNVQVFKDFDFWNDQLADKEGKLPYNLPAIFIQYSPIPWTPLKNGRKEGYVDISFYIMTSTKAARTKYGNQFIDKGLSRLDYPDLISLALRNWKPYFIENEGEENEIITQYASTFSPVSTTQSFNYDSVVVDVEVYRTKLTDYSGKKFIKHSIANYDLVIADLKINRP